MTIEKILAQLDRISADSWYKIKDNLIDVTIDDFDGFDKNWREIDREFVDEDAIDEVIEWFDENADYDDGEFYARYHFGDILVCVHYTSEDI